MMHNNRRAYAALLLLALIVSSAVMGIAVMHGDALRIALALLVVANVLIAVMRAWDNEVRAARRDAFSLGLGREGKRND